MRQLTVLQSEAAARRLVAYLVTERIAAQVDADKTGHIVWVRDEDQLARAKEILAHFQASPDDPKYHDAEKSAESIRRDEERQRREKLANVVEMRGRWGSGAGIKKRCPTVIAMIAISILVAILTNAGEKTDGKVMRRLLFVDPVVFSDAQRTTPPHYGTNILEGEVWRLVTPIFIHFGLTHLIFNMWWLFILGGQIEDRRGTLRFVLLALSLAIASNLGEAFVEQMRLPMISLGGGMSGVGYGVFGYVWMKVKYDNSAGFTLSRESVFVMVVWFVLCILRDFPPFDGYLSGLIRDKVANTAHLVGLFMGLAIGYAPVLLRRR